MHSHSASRTLWSVLLYNLKITENLREFCLCGLYLFTILEVKGETFLKHRNTQVPVPSALRDMACHTSCHRWRTPLHTYKAASVEGKQHRGIIFKIFLAWWKP